MNQAFKNVWPSFHPVDMLVGIWASLLLFLVILEKRKNTRQFRHGEEYGSARWGNAKDIASAYTPVPGGVGPMTINSLMLQTVMSAEKLVK